MTLMMMGTASEIAAAPTETVTFLEDLADDQLVSATKLSPGLGNFGNTCYLNSTVQVLHKIPDLKQALATAAVGMALALDSSGTPASPDRQLVLA